MVRIITFGSNMIWLFIEQLHAYQNAEDNSFVDTEEYVCYFKFTEPTLIIYGELILDPATTAPMVFNSIDEAEIFDSAYLAQRFNLES